MPKIEEWNMEASEAVWEAEYGLSAGSYLSAEEIASIIASHEPGWIPCSERLPTAEEEDMVLAISSKGKYGLLSCCGDGVWRVPPNINHWRPLPTPPDPEE